MSKLTPEDISDEALNLILTRMALQAVKDYEHAYKVHKKAYIKYVQIKRKSYRTKSDREILGKAKGRITITERDMRDIEEFFRSPLGEAATNISGDKAVKILRERARKYGYFEEDEGLEGMLEK